MTESNIVDKTLDALLEIVEVEFKIPLGFAEVKLPVTAHAKKWWKNKKSRLEVEKAIRRAEQSFIAAHPDNKLAQMLHEFPLYAEQEFKQVIAGLLTHLDEEKITWLAQVKLTKTWGNIVKAEEIRKALELYIPYLRHELNGIEEFRDVITARAIERIDERTKETVEGVRRIETKLDKALESRENKTKRDEPDFWYIPHPYPMAPNFTGRDEEQQMLDNWLAEDTNRLFILRALGGFGKSALAWQWINTHVNPAKWTKLVWWSFYEGDASFEHFIEETLKYLKLDVLQGHRPQVDALLKAMQRQKILLIMDGFERALRAYSSMNAAYQGDEEESPFPSGRGDRGEGGLDCVNINAEIFLKSVCSLPIIKSKVLMATRLTPRAIKPRGEFMLGCREEELTAMQKADAVEFFHKQKIEGIHAEIEAACAPYGYHPLSLRLLAGRILKDFENPADIVVAQKLKIDGDLKQQKHRVLEVSYGSLPTHEQKLLSTIACFRSPVELKTLETIDVRATGQLPLQDDLHDLVERGLLHFDKKNKKFDLHPIVRRYAYDSFAPANRIDVHTRLRDYFADLKEHPSPKDFSDLLAVIEHYYHTVKLNELEMAWLIYRTDLSKPLYFQLSKYDLVIELLQMFFDDSSTILVGLKNEDFQSWTLNEISNAYCLSGQPKKAISTYKQSIEFDIAKMNKRGLASSLCNMASLMEIPLGAIKNADRNLRQAIALDKAEKNLFGEASDRQEMGRLMVYRGAWLRSEQELSKALNIAEKIQNFQNQTLTLSYCAMRFMMMSRNKIHLKSKYIKLAVDYSIRSLELADKTTESLYSYHSDYMRVYWLLGAACREDNKLSKAEECLSNAIDLCRQSNNVMFEADILLDLARLRSNQKNYGEAKSHAEESLYITERCGYVLQGADVNLFLAQFALEQEQDKVKAKEYAEEALKLATCDGPPYYYKVAYEEAERLLEKLNKL